MSAARHDSASVPDFLHPFLPLLPRRMALEHASFLADGESGQFPFDRFGAHESWRLGLEVREQRVGAISNDVDLFVGGKVTPSFFSQKASISSALAGS